MAFSDPVLNEVLTHLGYGSNHRLLEPIHGGQSGGRLFRLETQGRQRLVLKLLEQARIPSYLREDYPHIDQAEWRFYTELGPKLALPLPIIYDAGQLNGCSFILMEDLSVNHCIPRTDHHWTETEMHSVLTTYAMLHSRTLNYLAHETTPGWLHQDVRTRFSPTDTLVCLQRFYDNDWTRDAVKPILDSPAVGQLLEQIAVELNGLSASILFNDFYPPNVALPTQGGPAKLFDWQLVGLGPLHIDIVNIGFLSHQDSFAEVDGMRLLDFYLQRWADETGMIYDLSLFMDEYRLAALLAWSVFMPRMVKAMEQANSQGKRFSAWMEHTFTLCVTDWMTAINGETR